MDFLSRSLVIFQEILQKFTKRIPFFAMFTGTPPVISLSSSSRDLFLNSSRFLLDYIQRFFQEFLMDSSRGFYQGFLQVIPRIISKVFFNKSS